MTRIFTVSNNKGGILKTTLVSHFAGIEAMKGHRCLIIDLDNQSNISTTFGLNPDDFRTTVYDVLLDGLPPEDAVVNVQPGIDILPSDRKMASFELDVLLDPDIPNDITILTLLNKRMKHFDFSQYDFVFVDVPPTLSLILANALSISGEVIIPVQPELYAAQGLMQTVDVIRTTMEKIGLDARINCIVLTNVELVNVHSHYTSEIRKFAAKQDIRCLDEIIHKSKLVPDYISLYGKPVTMETFDKKVKQKYEKPKENFEEVWSEIING
jgi:chromosome partitioning protein